MAGANMTRNQGLAGQSVKQGGYTVTYDENGYAKKAVKDGGSSATSTVKTTQANNSTAHQKAYQAAQKGDWDAVGAAVNEIAYAGGSDPNKGYDFTDANKYMQELQDQFKYNARDYYDQQYDKTYGAGSSAVFDATGGAVKTADQWNQLTGGAALPTAGSTGTESGSSVQNSGSDAYQYIRDMYEQQAAAQLAALKSTYEQNVADSKAYDDLISASYQNQKNQAAAQNDLQRMYMNELGIMQGLNTGATGQMALAQSAALQGNMAQIGAQEAQSLSDNALERQKLAIAYRNAVNEAEAEGNYQLASALYQEYVRQDNLARQKEAEAQEQANWQAKFDYQKQQDAWANAEAQAELLAGFGDFSGYKALGYSDAQIAMMQNAWNAKYGTPAVGTTGTPGANPGYNNGGLTPDQVKVLQNYYGVTADGAWGKNSTSAAGGMTAAQAWEAYLAGPLKSIEQSVGMNRTSNGQATAIQNALTSGRITEAQAEDMLKKFGIM